MKTLLTLVVLTITISVQGQVTKDAIFEDASGKSSILFPTGYIGLNTSGETLTGRVFFTRRLGNPKVKVIHGQQNKEQEGQRVKYFAKLPEGEALAKPSAKYQIVSPETFTYKPGFLFIIPPKVIIERHYTAEITQFDKDVFPVKTLTVKKYSFNSNYVKEPAKGPVLTDAGVKVVSEKESLVDPTNTAASKKEKLSDGVETTLNGPLEHTTYFTIYRDSTTSTASNKMVFRQYTDIYDSTEIRKVIPKSGRFYYGLTVTGGTADGITAIFSERDLNIGASLDLHVGWKALLFRNIKRCKNCSEAEYKSFQAIPGKNNFTIDYLTFTAGYIGEKYSIITKTSGTAFDSVMTSVEFRGRTLGLTYNIVTSGNWIIGVGWNWQETNNNKSLSNATLTTRNTFYDSATATSKSVDVSKSGKLGPLERFTRRNLLLDIVYMTPINSKQFNIAINPYSRTSFDPGKKTVTNFGAGAYLINPLNSKVIVGLFAEYADLFDKLDTEGKDFDRLSIGISLKRQFLAFSDKQTKL